jgi:hypothetical protein
MANDGSASGISPAQAALLASLLQAQSQEEAASILGIGATTGQTGQGLDFSSLLSDVLGMTQPVAVSPAAAQASPLGQRIATTAMQLAADLRGANNRSYDPATTPSAAQAVWQTPGWGNGNVQCVAFVDGAYRQAGIALPAAPNAADFWSAYAALPGWTEIANGSGLPRPGDIIAMRGGEQGFGHVAIVTGVTPPQGGQPGTVTIAQSNSPTATDTLTIQPNGQVVSWPGFTIQGFVRPTGA